MLYPDFILQQAVFITVFEKKISGVTMFQKVTHHCG